MSRLPCILGCLAILLGCTSYEEQMRRDVYEAVLIDPSRMPVQCSLEWTVKPNFMRADDESGRLLEMISGFWFGDLQSSGVEPPVSAVSNIYSLRNGDPERAVLTIVAFEFPNDRSRAAALRFLSASLNQSERHRFVESPPYVITMGIMDPSIGDCRDWFWTAVKSKLPVTGRGHS